MTEQDRSAPLSVAQLTADIFSRCTRIHGASVHGACFHDHHKAAALISDALSAAYAEGVRTGRRQALEDAAAAVDAVGMDDRDDFVATWLRARATRRDEAHAERTQR